MTLHGPTDKIKKWRRQSSPLIRLPPIPTTLQKHDCRHICFPIETHTKYFACVSMGKQIRLPPIPTTQ